MQISKFGFLFSLANFSLSPLFADTPPATINCLTPYSSQALSDFLTSTSVTLSWNDAHKSLMFICSFLCLALWSRFITALLRPEKLKL